MAKGPHSPDHSGLSAELRPGLPGSGMCLVVQSSTQRDQREQATQRSLVLLLRPGWETVILRLLLKFFGWSDFSETRSRKWPTSTLMLVCVSLGSGPRDHVFVYFTDHGATGILVFPNEDVSFLMF